MPKGRQGTRHHAAKLNDDKVQQILLDYYRDDLTMLAIARKFNVAETTIWYICNRHLWRHVPPPAAVAHLIPEPTPRTIQ